MRVFNHTVKPYSQEPVPLHKRTIRKRKTPCTKSAKAKQDFTEQTSSTFEDPSVAANLCASTSKCSPHSPKESSNKIRTKSPQYDTLVLKGPEKDDPEIGFRVYKERDLAIASSPVMQNIEAKDPAVDFDCPTESEQADSSARAMDSQIAEALEKFDVDKSVVINASKFKRRTTGRRHGK